MRIALSLVFAALAACAPLPQRTQLPAHVLIEQRASPNFDQRRPAYVVLHHTGSAYAERALSTLTDRARGVSAHYLVARDGRVYHLVDELARAWHAGESFWAGNRDINSASVGIELDNEGDEPYPDAQVAALLALLADLQRRYAIPSANFLGHADVAPRRKTDPGRTFPWKRLSEAGFGLWCDPPHAPPPRDLETAALLAAFGYDVSDTEAAVGAFKRRYVPGDASRTMTEDDRARLWCLLARKRDQR